MATYNGEKMQFEESKSFRINFSFFIVSKSIYKYYLPRKHSGYHCFCAASVSLVNFRIELKTHSLAS